MISSTDLLYHWKTQVGKLKTELMYIDESWKQLRLKGGKPWLEGDINTFTTRVKKDLSTAENMVKFLEEK